ncbi:MAG TPA: sulfatase-like hydrolase/transferase [Planctomycetota bacterium]|jgi:arylsulfatase A
MRPLRLSLVFLILFSSAGLLAEEPARKPNIILILIDDMGYGDIGPYGSKLNRTPNLDRMASEGLKLTSFYACPVCTPSRAQFLTGCYAKRVSLPNVIFPACAIGLNPNENTLPKLMKQQGYATLCVGKWHVGDQREFLPPKYGFDHYFGLPYSNDMGGGEEWPKEGATKGRKPPLPLVRDLEVIETVSPKQQDKLTKRYTEAVTDFIKDNKKNPFFIYFPHTAVHIPLHPGEKFQGKSGNGTYGDWVEEVDWSVGQVLDTLRELHLEKDTLVFFTSDNGPWLTQRQNGGTAGPLRGGKGSTWEGGMREPTIAWWPGKIAAASACDAVTGNVDMLPTFVKLAGGTVPTDKKIDGVDIWPVLSGQTKESAREAQYYFYGNRLDAVRCGPWKLAIQPQHEAKPGEKGPPPDADKAHTPRLYNLVEDVGETTDVSAKNPDVVKRLQELVAKMDADLGATTLGPGVREPGRVEKPIPLLKSGLKVLDSATAGAAATSLDTLKTGDTLDSQHAPQVAGMPLIISAEVESQAKSGIILAHGGEGTGYAVHLRDGKLVFTVREKKEAVDIVASETPPGRFTFEARLAAGGAMSLFIDGKKVAEGKARGLLSIQPMESFCLGFDDAKPVADYANPARFSGTISKLSVRTIEK